MRSPPLHQLRPRTSNSILSAFLVLTPITFVLKLLMLGLVLAEICLDRGDHLRREQCRQQSPDLLAGSWESTIYAILDVSPLSSAYRSSWLLTGTKRSSESIPGALHLALYISKRTPRRCNWFCRCISHRSFTHVRMMYFSFLSQPRLFDISDVSFNLLAGFKVSLLGCCFLGSRSAAVQYLFQLFSRLLSSWE